MKTCPDCNGDGVVDRDTDDERQCPTCGGLGFVPDDDDQEEVIKTSCDLPHGVGGQTMKGILWPRAISAETRARCTHPERHLAGLDIGVSPWGARWRDHFLLMTSFWVWDFRVDALISDRRGRTPLCSAGGAVPCSSSVPGGSLPCGIVFSTAPCVSPVEAAKVISGTKHKHRKISAAPIVQLTAHARPILVQSYLQYRFCWRFLLRWIKRR